MDMEKLAAVAAFAGVIAAKFGPEVGARRRKRCRDHHQRPAARRGLAYAAFGDPPAAWSGRPLYHRPRHGGRPKPSCLIHFRNKVTPLRTYQNFRRSRATSRFERVAAFKRRTQTRSRSTRRPCQLGSRAVRQVLRRERSCPRSTRPHRRARIEAKTADLIAPRQKPVSRSNAARWGNFRGRFALACQDFLGKTVTYDDYMAERQGFEPWVGSPPQRFSRPPRSTAPASLR